MRYAWIVLVTLSVGRMALAPWAGAAPEPSADPAAAPEHVEVDPSDTCDRCHAEVTPEIHAAWFSGAHGLNNVKCFVCHGDTTERFTVQVGTERCRGCHAMEQGDLAGTSCFSCHPPHRLSPHRLTLPGEPATGAAEEGGRP